MKKMTQESAQKGERILALARKNGRLFG